MLAVVAVVVLAAALVLLAWPQLLGLQRLPVIAQATSLRAALAGVAVLCIVLGVLIAIMWPRIRRAAATVAVLLLAFVLIQAAVLGTRGWGATGFEPKQPGDVTVLAWNTFGDSTPVETVAELVLEEGADVVVLPETTADFARQVATAVQPGGVEMTVHAVAMDEVLKARSTSVLVSTELGEYARDDTVGTTDRLPSVVLVPVDGRGPTIVGAHPVAPVPGAMVGWRQGLTWLAARCASPNTIVAGDLNSTLDHYVGLDPATERLGGLGGCLDGARETGNAAVGTWPTDVPAVLGAPIDHVMATDDWRFVGFRVVDTLDGAGSDHRPVVAQLRPADSSSRALSPGRVG